MDDLKQKAGEQSRQLAEKQEEADAALREITASMQVNNLSIKLSWRTCTLKNDQQMTYKVVNYVLKLMSNINQV